MAIDLIGRCKWLLLTTICLLATFLFTACGSATQLTQPTTQTVLGFQTSNFTVTTADGRVRSYIVYAPPGNAKRPLVLVFHGAEDTAESTVQETDFLQAADQSGFVVAFLQGYEKTWNEGAGHTPAEVAHVNDVEFTSDALTQIEQHYSIDRTRIAAAGLSNGALLTELLGCRLAERLTLIAPVAGQLPASVSPTCRPPRPISVLEMHGTADQTIPYAGGPFVGIGGGTTVLSAPASAARWASLDGCSSSRRTLDTALATVLTTYSACHKRVVVELRSLQGAGHAWPADVGVLVAEFLHQHPGAPAT
ncbi:MAG TPA: PHB depolymerase family esterase [Solirubrobacteraceae bacterium]|jgi:polyhydroxybutyrate depolymerase